uniref:Calmodulin-lysine N-methyltransferase n=1 Tax=Timema genevievae TaxID=629358 RepID=A0A7R9JZB1_TIMGE|nr:unnamed protein product [Timema genevievae]
MSVACNGLPPQRVLGEGRNEVARQRWKLLACALQKNTDTGPRLDDVISLRRFTSYQLITSCPLERSDPPWFQYSATLARETYHVDVRHPVRPFTATELMGFNNTGNICVWPSEEVLAYHVLGSLVEFRGQAVLELGGGMTCLAGLMLAKYSAAASVRLTDGNRLAVDNLGHVVERNGLGGNDCVTFSVLQWGDLEALGGQTYDAVLSADCLFFDDARRDLVETLWAALRPNGVALVMAPGRGGTLAKFAEEARLRGFTCASSQRYNEHVWRRHLEMKNSCNYDEDIHYPLLLTLTKTLDQN